MSNADERLDTIKRENRCNSNETVSFLLEELDYWKDERALDNLLEQNEKLKRDIKKLIQYGITNTVNYPDWLENLADDYAIEYVQAEN